MCDNLPSFVLEFNTICIFIVLRHLGITTSINQVSIMKVACVKVLMRIYFVIKLLKKMKYNEYHEKLTLLKKLIIYGNTGSPKDLSKILNVSERTVRRLVDELRYQKMSIVFCRKSNSYLLKE